MPQLSVIGLMSGSSLDGVDLAWCTFRFSDDNKAQLLSWELHKGTTLPYTEHWQQRLRNAPQLSGRDLWQLHTELGHYFGECVAHFQAITTANYDLVASHGHTIFHFPAKATTTQIGDGAAIAAHLQAVVIDQFRSLDMALGGQGAPLAPLADQYLFGDYYANLNLGGIANISINGPSGYTAFDIGGANQILDALMQEVGLAYDDQGQLARKGKLLPELLAAANRLDYFSAPYPKSLGNDWVQEQLLPLFQNKEQALADRLHTFVEHLAQQIARSLQQIIVTEGTPLHSEQQMLVAGGGGFNTYLCERITMSIQPVQLQLAAPDIIAYKEAALMALAGALRWLGQPNVLPNVTGASRASIGGAVHDGR